VNIAGEEGYADTRLLGELLEPLERRVALSNVRLVRPLVEKVCAAKVRVRRRCQRASY
jgi:hypothetical protein